MDVRSLFAAQKYAAQRPATEPQPSADSATSRLKGAAQDFAAFRRVWWCQVCALTRKNYLVQKRSPVATAAQLGVGLIFLFMLSLPVMTLQHFH